MWIRYITDVDQIPKLAHRIWSRLPRSAIKVPLTRPTQQLAEQLASGLLPPRYTTNWDGTSFAFSGDGSDVAAFEFQRRAVSLDAKRVPSKACLIGL